MYCLECGEKAEGNFCWKCGSRLHHAPASAAPGPSPEPVGTAAPGGDGWADEVRYDVLIQHPRVRDLIVRHGARAHEPVSGELLMKMFDKLKLTPVPLEIGSQVTLKLWKSLGMKSAVRTRTETIARPCGQAIVVVLCSLAQHSQSVSRVDQADDGCTIHAALPSDFRALEGEVKIVLKRRSGQTLVEASAWSNGQLYDWGKSNTSLDRLFTDLRELKLDDAAAA